MEERKIKYLFDSSAIFDLTKLGGKALDFLKNNYTITLAYYELGNILWKYKDKLGIEAVFNALSAALSFVNIIEVKLDKEIVEEAIKNNLTYYDSAYLVTAKRIGAKLVSLDKDLINNGAITMKDLLKMN
ncbi:type II toxin-antitoxin system VapC family toxin [Acidianus brierleyi]|uniref:PIN domain-containing protein n=1 Tax=Acidianus brierleyi TaxID=41673 RepID=A0A2U9IDA0_9CREN|nr:type II toxin-antitoxin system VapC family toxin [Acidianus brierleyi]AWR94018.1 PIN domain-containing protein [Acidianus brierleyi]